MTEVRGEAAYRRQRELEYLCAHPSITLDDVWNKLKICQPSDFDCESPVLFKAVSNENITPDILKILLGFFRVLPPLLIDQRGTYLLHVARNNKRTSPEIVETVSSALPDLIRFSTKLDNRALGRFIHGLKREHTNVDESHALDSLKLLIQVRPESLRTKYNFRLPMYWCRGRSLAFDKLFVESFPESLQARDSIGCLLFHYACQESSLVVVP